MGKSRFLTNKKLLLFEDTLLSEKQKNCQKL